LNRKKIAGFEPAIKIEKEKKYGRTPGGKPSKQNYRHKYSARI